ncbi:MAG: hypothetical protein NT105_08250 [Verrucomicrobia bacterium]|nr:hypothetical protein [Verrucomicrobiota bacterium]
MEHRHCPLQWHHGGRLRLPPRPAFWGEVYDRARHYKRVRKIIIHELGHTFGQRDHCEDWACAVHGSGSIGEIDKTGEDYCKRCNALAAAAIASVRGKP